MVAAAQPHRYGLGWRKQKPDYRDRWLAFSPYTVSQLPVSQDRFATGLPPIWDQGQTSACTSHAILRCNAFAAAKAGITPDVLSRLFLYYNERAIEGTTAIDGGAAIRDGIKSLVAQGACLETLWPFDPHQITIQPPQPCYANAINHQALKYAAVIPSLDQIKATLHSGFPVVVGSPVYQGWMSSTAASNGLIPIPLPGEPDIGGHAYTLNGFYDDQHQLLGFDNSWSPQWGDSGSGYLPYWYVQNQLLADCWVIYQTEGVLPEPTPGPGPQPPAPPTRQLTPYQKQILKWEAKAFGFTYVDGPSGTAVCSFV